MLETALVPWISNPSSRLLDELALPFLSTRFTLVGVWTKPPLVAILELVALKPFIPPCMLMSVEYPVIYPEPLDVSDIELCAEKLEFTEAAVVSSVRFKWNC